MARMLKTDLYRGIQMPRLFLLSLLAILMLLWFQPSECSAASYEPVLLLECMDKDYKAIIVRNNGDQYLIEYGVGVISIWRYEGKTVYIHSPALFAGIGSEIVLTREGQRARIWNAEYMGNIYSKVPTPGPQKAPTTLDPKPPAPVVTPGQSQSIPSSTTKTRIILNGSPLSLDVDPIIRNGRTFVPFRDIGEALGAQVDWNAGLQSALYVKPLGEYNLFAVAVTVGSDVAQVVIAQPPDRYTDPKPFEMGASPFIHRGRTMVPLRFISNALGGQVTWDKGTSTVYITCNH